MEYLAKQNPGSNWSNISYAKKAAADAKKIADNPKVDERPNPSDGLMNMMVDILLHLEVDNIQADGKGRFQAETERVGPELQNDNAHGVREEAAVWTVKQMTRFPALGPA